MSQAAGPVPTKRNGTVSLATRQTKRYSFVVDETSSLPARSAGAVRPARLPRRQHGPAGHRIRRVEKPRSTGISRRRGPFSRRSSPTSPTRPSRRIPRISSVRYRSPTLCAPSGTPPPARRSATGQPCCSGWRSANAAASPNWPRRCSSEALRCRMPGCVPSSTIGSPQATARPRQPDRRRTVPRRHRRPPATAPSTGTTPPTHRITARVEAAITTFLAAYQAPGQLSP